FLEEETASTDSIRSWRQPIITNPTSLNFYLTNGENSHARDDPKTLTVLNLSQETRRIRLDTSQLSHFRIDGRYPKLGSASIAPGLSCKIMVTPVNINDQVELNETLLIYSDLHQE
ncbi:unnamed protein product, partial [Hymenolepis diminuta]